MDHHGKTLIAVVLGAALMKWTAGIFAVIGFVIVCVAGFVWLARVCPLAAIFVLGFIRGLLSGGRGRW